jgi:hypothetical protein
MVTKVILEDIDIIGVTEIYLQKIIQIIQMIAKKVIPRNIQGINVKVIWLDILVIGVGIMKFEVLMAIGAIIIANKLLICPVKIVVMIQFKVVLDDDFKWENMVIHIVIVLIVTQK